MKSVIKSVIFCCLLLVICCTKTDAFPVTAWNADSKKPVIFYISGDGGFNTFSKTFAQELHRHGYDVFALNTKKYFWHKRTPAQASLDVENYLKDILQKRQNKKVIFLGYSYGADVAPFIYNRFDAEFRKNIQQIIIIGPSKVNDFEIHLQDYIQTNKQRGYSVIKEINKLKNVDFTLVVSDFEKKYFPAQEIALKNYNYVHIPGNHHFNEKTKMLADSVVKYFVDSKISNK